MNAIQQRQLFIKLGLAIQKGNIKQVRQLIAEGVDVNTVDRGLTPLSLAIMYSHINIEIARVLIEAGADVNIANEQLFSAVKKGDIERVRKLIAVGVNVDITDEDGRTPLNLAASVGYTKMVEILVNKGAGVNIADKNGYTPLHWTIIQGLIESTKEVMKTLINEGADVNMEDKNGSTPLHWAVGIDDIRAIELIVSYIAKLRGAGLHVSEKNLQEKEKFIGSSDERRSNYLQHRQNYEEEAKKIEKENKLLYGFLKESNIGKLTSIWERNEDVRSKFDNQESLQEQYPEYAHILINKANEVKKEIFLHNNKPLIGFLSTHYRCDFQTITLAGIKNFFDVHRNNFEEGKIGCRNNTLIHFVDFEDITARHAPKLKVQVFASHIRNNVLSTNLESSNAEQIQRVGQAH